MIKLAVKVAAGIVCGTIGLAMFAAALALMSSSAKAEAPEVKAFLRCGTLAGRGEVVLQIADVQFRVKVDCPQASPT